MKNTKNNLIVLGFMGLTILILGILTLSPMSANAGGFDVRNPRPVIHSLYPNPIYWDSGPISIKVIGNNFAQGAVVKINNSDRSTVYLNDKELKVTLVDQDTLRLSDSVVTVDNPSPGGGRSNSIILNVTREYDTVGLPGATVTSNTNTGGGAVQGATTTKTTKPATKATPKAQDNSADEANELTANALFGADGFFPTSLIGWLLLAILVLLLVIIFRKMFREDKYHETPLKHA